MALRSSFKPAFQRAFDQLSQEKQTLAVKALEALRHYFQTGEAGYGLRVKKLYAKGGRKTFEARVSLDLRILWVQTDEEAVFSLLGDHEEVQRFLKNL